MIELGGIYDPCRPNDRLLLGMMGSISEFELRILRARTLDATSPSADTLLGTIMAKRRYKLV